MYYMLNSLSLDYTSCIEIKLIGTVTLVFFSRTVTNVSLLANASASARIQFAEWSPAANTIVSG